MEIRVYKCPYCNHRGPIQDFHKEHIVAKKQREVRTRNVLLDEKGIYGVLPDTVPACKRCNLSKGAKSPGQWARWLKGHPDKWYPWPDGDRRRWMNLMLTLP